MNTPFLLFCFCLFAGFQLPASTIGWPTPNTAFLEDKSPKEYLQPTESGRLESAKYGCTRNRGSRFHEGIDLKSVVKLRNGRSSDPIFSITDGKVAYVNNDDSKSSYGKYVVINHGNELVEWSSLYAHLRSVPQSIRAGTALKAGEIIGTMGATSGSIDIPESRAHLHFEICFRMNTAYQNYYETRDYEDPNAHGSWNGLNLLGVDPIGFYRYILSNPHSSPESYFLGQEVAFTILAFFERRPDFLKRNPIFLEKSAKMRGRGWYEIGFTWYGLPVRWINFEPGNKDELDKKSIKVVSLKHEKSCKNWIDDTPAGLEATNALLEWVKLLKQK